MPLRLMGLRLSDFVRIPKRLKCSHSNPVSDLDVCGRAKGQASIDGFLRKHPEPDTGAAAMVDIATAMTIEGHPVGINAGQPDDPGEPGATPDLEMGVLAPDMEEEEEEDEEELVWQMSQQPGMVYAGDAAKWESPLGGEDDVRDVTPAWLRPHLDQPDHPSTELPLDQGEKALPRQQGTIADVLYEGRHAQLSRYSSAGQSISSVVC